MRQFALPLLALTALAACDSATQETPMDAATETVAETSPGVMEPAVTPTLQPPVATAIPAAVQGRWGMVPADCEPGRADAKGLLEITATQLEFYESVGKLDDIAESSDTRIRAGFDFSGEGMTWRRDVVLDVQDGDETLIRREYGEDAAPGPFSYTRCD
jgi:hypothetical protein